MTNAAPQHRALIVLTSHERLGDTGRPTGFYLSEVAHPWKVFADAGVPVDLVSVQGGAPPMDGADPSDPIQRQFRSDPVMAAQLVATARPEQIDPDRYDIVLYAGGHGTMWDFPGNAELAAIAARVYEAGGVVAAVCHGPAGLLDITLSDGSFLVAGKRVAAFTNAEEAAAGLTDVVPFLLADQLEGRGAEHLPGPDFEPNVVTDGRLVTGQNPASATGVAQAVLAALDATASTAS